MGVDQYFGTIILILEGLSFIAILLVFLYMIYGEKEESAASARVTLPMKILDFFLHLSTLFSVVF